MLFGNYFYNITACYLPFGCLCSCFSADVLHFAAFPAAFRLVVLLFFLLFSLLFVVFLMISAAFFVVFGAFFALSWGRLGAFFGLSWCGRFGVPFWSLFGRPF